MAPVPDTLLLLEKQPDSSRKKRKIAQLTVNTASKWLHVFAVKHRLQTLQTRCEMSSTQRIFHMCPLRGTYASASS